ncbi:MULTISPECIES: NAD-dependent epimerase/dehydratase family protein [unclassified Staphylococcus]|uniref:NAD-dependent epimerase/dehydratase family protein n=1 Tax=unclassified Staphylococcus TaxID=91994 RepID=UPI0021D261B2|nr:MULTISPECIES: NAD-dependent epimerase/dehydratase family protein [unclassified Staphylococcus]UXR76411.1 NAD-dependent epimerase/dehydratase family protein [Staphylococcus sp. IVB6233]UXR80538.1 NAD-dependent epimerase/dehydratase family protein [Staphylococcus sp. IVB6218]
MKLLITGANGHSGKLFLENLSISNSKKYEEIHVIVRNDDLDRFIEESKLNIVKHKGDLTDTQFLEEVTQNIDVILHIAGIQMSQKLFKVAIENKVKWIIAVHTTGRYSQFKMASEEYIKIEDHLLTLRDKINITILRPTMIYGSSRDRNMYRLIKFIDKSPIFPVFGNGNNLMQPVTATDLAVAYEQVLDNSEICKNQNYNLSGKYPIKYKELIKTVASKLNKNIILLHIPIKLSYYAVLIGNRVLPKFPLNEEQVLRMKEDKDFTYLKAERDFGYNPMSFEEGIELEVNEYKGEK